MMLDRGETLDWFDSREIILEACIAGVAFYVFLVQFCLAPGPSCRRSCLLTGILLSALFCTRSWD